MAITENSVTQHPKILRRPFLIETKLSPGASSVTAVADSGSRHILPTLISTVSSQNVNLNLRCCLANHRRALTIRAPLRVPVMLPKMRPLRSPPAALTWAPFSSSTPNQPTRRQMRHYHHLSWASGMVWTIVLTPRTNTMTDLDFSIIISSLIQHLFKINTSHSLS